jgi:hypothetical protein
LVDASLDPLVSGWMDWLAASGADYHLALRALGSPVVASTACSKRVCVKTQVAEDDDASEAPSIVGATAAAAHVIRASGGNPLTVPLLRSWILELHGRVSSAQVHASAASGLARSTDAVARRTGNATSAHSDSTSEAMISAAAQLRFTRAWAAMVHALNPRFVLRTGFVRKLVEAVEHRNGAKGTSHGGGDILLRAAWSLLRCPFGTGEDTARECPGEWPHGSGAGEGTGRKLAGGEWDSALEEARRGLGGLSAARARQQQQTSCGGQ